MAEIKPIQTKYNGYKFRSRLEARWAVFFDNAGIEYRYEVEGFKHKRDCYLPDFYLPKSKTWVEVKGDPHALCIDYQRMNRMLRDGDMLPSFKNSLTNGGGLLLLGSIPNAELCSIHFHPIIQHDTEIGLCQGWVEFLPREDYARIDNNAAHYVYLLTGYDLAMCGEIDQDDSGEAWVVNTASIHTKSCKAKIRNAYIAARQARFEFGQKG